MPNILLIHGFGTRVTGHASQPKNDIDAGFGSYIRAHWIESNQAAVFRWGIPITINEINLLATKQKMEQLYHDEKALTTDPAFVSTLWDTVMKHKPHIIIAHSMGCHLTLQLLRMHGIPPTLRRIILTQADIPHTTNLSNWKNLDWINIHMPFDAPLNYSRLMNNYTPAGIYPITSPHTTNIAFSYTPTEIINHIRKQQWNTHDKIFENKEYFELLEEIVAQKI